MSKELTQERLRHLFCYDTETGVFTVRVTNSNRSPIGSVAGGINGSGYWIIRIDKKNYRAGRLAWLYVHGRWPVDRIDHINGIRTDDWIANLRDASSNVNAQNLHAPRRDNKSGYLGVSSLQDGRFMVTIHVGSRSIHIGYFKTALDASYAYLEAKRLHHPGCTI